MLHVARHRLPVQLDCVGKRLDLQRRHAVQLGGQQYALELGHLRDAHHARQVLIHRPRNHAIAHALGAPRRGRARTPPRGTRRGRGSPPTRDRGPCRRGSRRRRRPPPAVPAANRSSFGAPRSGNAAQGTELAGSVSGGICDHRRSRGRDPRARPPPRPPAAGADGSLPDLDEPLGPIPQRLQAVDQDERPRVGLHELQHADPPACPRGTRRSSGWSSGTYATSFGRRPARSCDVDLPHQRRGLAGPTRP